MAEFKITKEKLIERYTKEMKANLIKDNPKVSKIINYDKGQFESSPKSDQLEIQVNNKVEFKLADKLDIITKKLLLKMGQFPSEFGD